MSRYVKYIQYVLHTLLFDTVLCQRDIDITLNVADSCNLAHSTNTVLFSLASQIRFEHENLPVSSLYKL